MMTIASKLNAMAVANGGTADKSGTITGALDALNDALAGSDYQTDKSTIETALDGLGANIGGGSQRGILIGVSAWDERDDDSRSFFINIEDGRPIMHQGYVMDGTSSVDLAGCLHVMLDFFASGNVVEGRGIARAELDGEPFEDYVTQFSNNYSIVDFTVPMFTSGEHGLVFYFGDDR